jgi:hypothetical protein
MLNGINKEVIFLFKDLPQANGSEIQEAREVARQKKIQLVKTKYQIAKT